MNASPAPAVPFTSARGFLDFPVTRGVNVINYGDGSAFIDNATPSLIPEMTAGLPNLGGAKIEAKYIDEAGSTANQEIGYKYYLGGSATAPTTRFVPPMSLYAL